MINSICVIGAGTMGRGIAQVAAAGGFDCKLYDADAFALNTAVSAIKTGLKNLAAKQKLTEQETDAIFNRIQPVYEIKDCHADLIIEAIAENIDAKIKLFNAVAAVNASSAIFATNTSSLSISSIQDGIPRPERLAGMHFFNPPVIMKLVEVVKGDSTNDSTIQSIVAVVEKLGKIPIVCRDSPGFIVNRVARHFYLESLRLAEKGISFEEIDKIIESNGFKMGPFRLMDLIGIDVNFAVSQSIYKAFDNNERFKPSAIQSDKISKNELGRKTGKGFYEYE